MNTMKYPPRPHVPDPYVQARLEHQEARYLMLRERSREKLTEWIKAHISADRVERRGPPDDSASPLVAYCHHASRPGLYASEPTVTNPADPDGGRDLVELLHRSGLWTRMQAVQYFTAGLNRVFLRIAVDRRRRRLTFRPVYPHNVIAYGTADDPTEPIEIRELRIRQLNAAGRSEPELAYCWDVWSIRDPDRPYFRVHRASTRDDLGDDVTSLAIGEEAALQWETYPYRDSDDEPVLPWSVYRSVDDGTMFSEDFQRGAFTKSLHVMMAYSELHNTAHHASATANFLIDGELQGVTTQRTHQGTPLDSVVVEPGTTLPVRTVEDSKHQARVVSVSPGGNLPHVMDYTLRLEMMAAMQLGMNPDDVTRGNQNPTSGVALYLSNEGKRELQRQFEPLFRRSDLDTIRRAAIVAEAHDLGRFPTDGYGITYASIPKSPQERAAEREHLDWMVERGVGSAVDRYIHIHPGVSREGALRALAENIAEQRRINALADELSGVSTPTDEPTTD